MPIDQIRTFIREAHNENEMIEVILFNSCHKKYYFILDTTFDSFIVSTLLRSNFITINFSDVRQVLYHKSSSADIVIQKKNALLEVYGKDQSPRYNSFKSLIGQNPGKRITGFPFNLNFPKTYGGQKYNIILCSGEELTGIVDDSREFMSEGLEWKTNEGNKERAYVAGWKRLVQ